MSYLLMYDAVNAGVPSIPDGVEAVAGYVDGHADLQSYPLLVKRFWGKAHVVSIGVFLGHTADVTDVEPGNPINTPALVRADFEHRKARGVWRPCYYADETRMSSTVLPGLAGVPRSEYRLWVANWDGTRIPMAGYEAKQYTDTGQHDISLVDREAFFPQPKPTPTPPAPTFNKVYDDGFNASWNANHHFGAGMRDTWFYGASEGWKPPPPPPAKKGASAKLAKLAPVRKVVAAGAGGGAGVGIAAALNAAGVHLTPAEGGAIVNALAILSGYMTPPGKPNA